MVAEFQICKMRSSRKLFQDNINVINTTELNTKMTEMANFTYFLITIKKKKHLSINSIYTADPQKT